MKRLVVTIIAGFITLLFTMPVAAQNQAIAYVNFVNNRPNCSGIGDLEVGVQGTEGYLTVTADTVIERQINQSGHQNVPVFGANSVVNGALRVGVKYGPTRESGAWFNRIYWFDCFTGMYSDTSITANDDVRVEVVENKAKEILRNRHSVHPDDDRAVGSLVAPVNGYFHKDPCPQFFSNALKDEHIGVDRHTDG